MLGLFGGKDWNVVAVIFVRRDLYQISGQRAKGSDATKARDGAKLHSRSLFWAAFDQKGKFLEGGPGAGSMQAPQETLKKLEKELATNRTVQEVLKILESKQSDKAAKPLSWKGYPPRDEFGLDVQEGAN